MTTPEAKADRLVKALNDNTDALHGVKKRYRWSIFVTIILFLSLVFTVYTNHEDDVESCRSTNAVREDIDKKFGSIGAFLEQAISDSPENEEFIKIVVANLESSDCSNISWF